MDTTRYVPSASHSITVRLAIENRAGMLAQVTSAIGSAGGNIGAINIVDTEDGTIVRDVTINARSAEHAESMVEALRALDVATVREVTDRTFLLHEGGKLEVNSKLPLNSRDQLAMAYTPGVARVCESIMHDAEKAYAYTIKSNMVAIVSDGSAVLGLGDIGPSAAIPVMEGKAQLLKEFAGVNGFPLCLDTSDVDAMVAAIKQVAPVFGAINLEDIAAPRCFEIEEHLKAELDIPVFHDDQHGTAVVVAAALINALTIVDKAMADLKVVLVGVGAAGTAVTDLLLHMGVENIIGVDRQGALTTSRTDMNAAKQDYAERTNPNGEEGALHDVMQGADVFIGLSGPDVIDVDDLKQMADDPIVFALANPTPEIMPEDAYPHVAVMATGRSDYPNQINNVLCFPGLFKGMLACRATGVNNDMKVAAARAIANTIDETSLTPDYVVPSVFDKRVVAQVAKAIREAAAQTGAARIEVQPSN